MRRERGEGGCLCGNDGEETGAHISGPSGSQRSEGAASCAPWCMHVPSSCKERRPCDPPPRECALPLQQLLFRPGGPASAVPFLPPRQTRHRAEPFWRWDLWPLKPQWVAFVLLHPTPRSKMLGVHLPALPGDTSSVLPLAAAAPLVVLLRLGQASGHKGRTRV